MKNKFLFLTFCLSLLFILILIGVWGCGTNPTGGHNTGAPWIYVSDTNNDRIIVIDGTTNTTVEPIQLDQSPANIAASPDGRRLYCSMDDGQIYVIDTSTNTTIDAFTVSPSVADSIGMVVSHDSKYLYLTTISTSEFFKVDLTSGGYPSQSTLLIGTGSRIALNSNSTKAYVCVGGLDHVNTSLEVISLGTMTKEDSINVVNHPYDIAIVDNYAYLAISSAIDSVARVNLSNSSVEVISMAPVSFHGVASIPGKDKLYFTNFANPGEIHILKPSNFPAMQATIITSSEATYPERIAATADYAYVVDAVLHEKVIIIDANTDEIVKYIHGLNAPALYSNPVVVYKQKETTE